MLKKNTEEIEGSKNNINFARNAITKHETLNLKCFVFVLSKLRDCQINL